jgi:hypothetical protein
MLFGIFAFALMVSFTSAAESTVRYRNNFSVILNVHGNVMTPTVPQFVIPSVSHPGVIQVAQSPKTLYAM